MLARLYPGPHRPGGRPRAGHRSDDRVRAAARSPAGGARRFPAAARRAARLPATTRCRPTTRSRGWRDAARPARAARAVAARLVAAERDLGRASSGCPTRSPTSSTRRAPRSPTRYREQLRRRPSGSRRRGSTVAAWALCADTDEEAERLAASARMAFALLRSGQLIPVPPVDKALRVPGRAGRRPTRSAGGAARSSARPT